VTIQPTGEQIQIEAGDQRAVVVEVGAGLRSYSAAGRELVDGFAADEPSRSGRGQLLIPGRTGSRTAATNSTAAATSFR
jgi:aldose 1-epimerase